MRATWLQEDDVKPHVIDMKKKASSLVSLIIVDTTFRGPHLLDFLTKLLLTMFISKALGNRFCLGSGHRLAFGRGRRRTPVLSAGTISGFVPTATGVY